jgi:hypothetical protein
MADEYDRLAVRAANRLEERDLKKLDSPPEGQPDWPSVRFRLSLTAMSILRTRLVHANVEYNHFRDAVFLPFYRSNKAN